MTKMVQLSTAAYERLKNAKRPKESFSDVVMRLAGEPKRGTDPWARLADLWTEKDATKTDRIRRELRELDMKSAWDEPQT